MATTSSSSDAALLISRAQKDGTHLSHHLTRQLQSGRVLRLRRRVYLPAQAWLEAYPFQRLTYIAAAVSAQLDEPVFCRETALHLHGLPLIRLPAAVQVRAPSRHHVRKLPQPSMTGRLSPDAFLAAARHQNKELAIHQKGLQFAGFGTHFVSPTGIPASPGTIRADAAGQTVFLEDIRLALADTVPRMAFSDAVIVLDAALRGSDSRAAVPRDALLKTAETLAWSRSRLHRWTRAAAFADPLSESPGESLARALIHELGFTAPQLQVTLTVDGQSYRVDFLWDEAGIVGEFDGWTKFQDNGRESLRQEKIREDAIRSTGRTFMRCYWEDLQEPLRLKRKLQRAGVPPADA